MKLLTTEEVAAQLRLSPDTVRELVRRGVLRPARLCRKWIFTEEALEAAVRQAEQRTAQSVAVEA